MLDVMLLLSSNRKAHALSKRVLSGLVVDNIAIVVIGKVVILGQPSIITWTEPTLAVSSPLGATSVVHMQHAHKLLLSSQCKTSVFVMQITHT